MSACPHYQKTLWLDVYNELTDNARGKWDAHLHACKGCREEKRRMVQMVTTMQENLPVPPTAVLSPEKLIRLSNVDKPSLFTSRWWQQTFLSNRFKLIPALATFGMVLLVAGIFNYRSVLIPGSQITNHAVDMSSNMVTTDIEMIKNLDLLEDMETVQRLIHVVERASYLQPDPNHRNNTQGNRHHDFKRTYV